MDVFYAYTYGTAAWLAIEAAPLLLAPKLIAAALSPEVREATPLEIYLARCVGFALICIGVLTVLLSGSIPLNSRLSEAAAPTTDPEDPKAPYALPTLTVTGLYHATSAAYAYVIWTQTGITIFGLGVLFSGVLSAVALWCVLFASSNGRISRKTGADKRTSGFPFKNVEAEKRKAKKGL